MRILLTTKTPLGAPLHTGDQNQKGPLFPLPRNPDQGNPPGKGQSHPCLAQFLSSHDILGPPTRGRQRSGGFLREALPPLTTTQG